MVDMRVNGSSVVDSNNVGNIVTGTAYNASSNKIATMSDLPTVPTKVSDLTNDAGYTTNTGTITSVKMNGSTVASSGEADLGTVLTSHQNIKTINSTSLVGTGDVTVQPTLVSGTNIKTINNTSLLGSGNISVATTGDIPTVNNATLTIQKNGTTVNTFTANASSNVTANITVPTKVSDLTNDSGFTGVYDARSIVAAAGSTITEAQYDELWDAIQNNSQIIVSYLGSTAACGRVTDFGPNIVLSWIEYDKFYMLTVHSASGNVHNVTLDYDGVDLITEDKFYDVDWVWEDVGGTISNTGWQELYGAMNAGKLPLLLGNVAAWNIEEVDNVTSLVIKSNSDNVAYRLIIAQTNDNHTVSEEYITLATTSDIPDVQINGTSIVSNNTANILTESAYNSSTNKIATVSDLPGTVSLVDFYNTDFQIMNKHVPTDKSWLLSGAEETTIEINFDPSGTTDMSYMFYQCPNVESISFPWNTADTSTLTNTAGMFEGCENLSTIDNLSLFSDTSNVTNMARMFYGCKSLTWSDIGYWDTSSVTNMARMFYGCSSLTELSLNNFDFSNVTSYNGIFSGMSDNCMVSVKDQAAQDWILGLSSSNRPAAWSTANVVIYEGGGGFA